MSMKSLDLLPAMEKLPGGGASSRRSFRRQINDMLSTDQPFYAAESAIGASMGFWAIFKNVNVDDGVRETMTRAHNMAMPKYEGTLTDHWKEMMEKGPDSMRGFLSPLKGKYAEIEAADTLKQNGYTNVRIAENPNQPVWDITASGADGQTELTQVKTGGVGRSSEIQGLRKCLRSVFGSGSNVDMGAPKVVFHEQREISKRPERQRMATLGTVAACSQTSRPADQIPAQGGGERYSLCVAHRMRMANAPSRPASVAHHIPLLPHMASRWDHGADS